MSDSGSISEELDISEESINESIMTMSESNVLTAKQQQFFYNQIARNNPVRGKSPRKGNKRNDDDDAYEYSTVFDDDEDIESSKMYTADFDAEQSKVYADDFEIEQSRVYSEDFDVSTTSLARSGKSYTHDFEVSGSMNKSEKQSVQWHSSIVTKKKDISTVESSIKNIIPNPSIQSIQAELALEDIGKEVIRLRNQQREVLNLRRKQTVEKKARAEARRAQYVQELEKYQSELGISEAENKKLKNDILAAESSLVAAVEAKELFQASMNRCDNTITAQRVEIQTLSSQLKSVEKELEQCKQILSEKESRWKTEREQLLEKNNQQRMLLDVLKGSQEAMENRMTKERETLPQMHQRLLDDRMTRVLALEAELKHKEGVLRADEQARVARMEQMRKEVLEEASRTRQHLTVELAEERAALARHQAILESERSQIYSQRDMEKATIEAHKLELSLRDKELERAERELQRRVGALEAEHRLVDPHIRAAEQELERAREEREIARRLKTELEFKIAAVMDADQAMVVREDAVQSHQRKIATEKSALEQIVRNVHIQSETLRRGIAECRQERQCLHKVSLELARQMSLLRKAVSAVARINSSGSGQAGDEKGSGVFRSLDEAADDEDVAGALRWRLPTNQLVGTRLQDRAGAGNREALLRALDGILAAERSLASVASQLVPPTVYDMSQPQYQIQAAADSIFTKTWSSQRVGSSASHHEYSLVDASASDEQRGHAAKVSPPPIEHCIILADNRPRSSFDLTRGYRPSITFPPPPAPSDIWHSEEDAVDIRSSIDEADKLANILKQSLLKYGPALH